MKLKIRHEYCNERIVSWNHAILKRFDWIIVGLIKNNNTKMYMDMWKISGVRKSYFRERGKYFK